VKRAIYAPELFGILYSLLMRSKFFCTPQASDLI